jgi:hypothetical protein
LRGSGFFTLRNRVQVGRVDAHGVSVDVHYFLLNSEEATALPEFS